MHPMRDKQSFIPPKYHHLTLKYAAKLSIVGTQPPILSFNFNLHFHLNQLLSETEKICKPTKLPLI